MHRIPITVQVFFFFFYVIFTRFSVLNQRAACHSFLDFIFRSDRRRRSIEGNLIVGNSIYDSSTGDSSMIINISFKIS